MSRVRTFIALELSGAVIGRAAELIQILKSSGVDAGWVNLKQMHLTLKFLGDVPETELADVCRVVAQAAEKIEPFEIAFRGVGAFPSLEKPRTLWLGLEQGRDELAELNTALEDALREELRYPRDRQRFTPHLTLGRVRTSDEAAEQRLQALIAERTKFDANLTVVEEVVVFASYPSPGGFEHSVLCRAPLAE
jgi:2'-5' RNA ligase